MKYWGPINSPGGINGDDGYVNGNPATGTEGSIPTFQSFEQTMRELTNLVSKSGLTPDAVMNGIQVAQATQSHRINYGIDTGSADSLAVTLDPAPASLNSGLIVNVKKGGSANTTTTPTLNVNGLGSRIITYPNGGALAANVLEPNSLFTVVYDAVTSRWCLTSLNINAVTINSQVFGSRYVVFTSGTGTWPVPAGVFQLQEVIVVAGGGGGGGATTAQAAGGGNGGFTVQGSMSVTPASGITYVVGTGGAAGTPASDGGAGGNSSFGTFMATAGKGGQNNGNPGLTWDTPSGGMLQLTGQQGFSGRVFSSGDKVGGSGGMSVMGGHGGQGGFGGTNGNPGTQPGGGGGGGAGTASSGFNGGPGAPGIIIIRY